LIPGFSLRFFFPGLSILIVKKASLVIVHTEEQQKYLSSIYNAKNIQHIFHGLNLNKIPKKPNPKNLLLFGMISKAKGVIYLIKAMSMLPEFNATIAGNFVTQEDKDEILAAIKQHPKIKTNFQWIDEEQKKEYLSNAGIVVLPYLWAPYQSGILHNAMSYGLPVVVTKVGSLYEIVEKFKIGEIVQPKSSKSLAEGIRKVTRNYSKYKKGILKYRSLANWERVAAKHYELYIKVSAKQG